MESKGESLESRFRNVREEIQATVEALKQLRMKIKQNILEPQRSLNEKTFQLKQRKKFVENYNEQLKGDELVNLLGEIGKLEADIDRITKEQQESWKNLHYNHPQLSSQAIGMLPSGPQIEQLLSQIKNPDSIKEKFESKPLELIVTITDAQYIMNKFLRKK
jgi:hypothetical protein